MVVMRIVDFLKAERGTVVLLQCPRCKDILTAPITQLNPTVTCPKCTEPGK